MVLLDKNGVSYQSIRSTLKTGDIVFFKGSGIANLISKLEYSVCGGSSGNYTHVGMIILSDSFPIGSPYRLCDVKGHDYAVISYIFESTQSGLGGDGTLSVDGYKFLGCQLRKFDNVVETYD